MTKNIRPYLAAAFAAMAIGIAYYPERLPGATEPDFDIIYIPDIQKEAQPGHTAAYPKTMTWVKNFVQTSGDNVLMVVGLGDTIDTSINSTPYSGSQEQAATAAWTVLDNAGIPWILTSGNHDYVNNSFSPSRAVSPAWRDSGTGAGCTGCPSPGFFSGAYYNNTRLALWPAQAGGYGYQYSGQTAGDNGISIVRVNNAGFWHTFAMVDFFPSTAELNTAGTWIAAHPTDSVHLATHALGAGSVCTQSYWSSHTMQYWPWTTCNGNGVNSDYGLTESNSNSGQDIFAWAQGFPNIVTITAGHFYPNDPRADDGTWAYRTDSANDGHQIMGSFWNWQNLEDGPGPYNTAGSTVAWTAGGGACPAAGSTGCTAEVGFVVIARFSPANGTQKYYALSTNTGDYVANGSAVPAPANSSTTPLFTTFYSSIPLSGITVSGSSLLNGVARH